MPIEPSKLKRTQNLGKCARRLYDLEDFTEAASQYKEYRAIDAEGFLSQQDSLVYFGCVCCCCIGISKDIARCLASSGEFCIGIFNFGVYIPALSIYAVCLLGIWHGLV
jgi:hypothetical protein